MLESQPRRAQSERFITIRFRMRSTSDAVVARLLEAVRRTDLSLVTVSGDGHRVYPFGPKSPARSASLWRAELLWRVDLHKPGWHLELFLYRAELFLDCPDGVRLQPPGGGWKSGREGQDVSRTRLREVPDRVRTTGG